MKTTRLDGLRAKAEETRARLLEAIPARYSPWAHLAATTGVGVGALTVGLWGIKGVAAAELLVIPVTVVVANGVEWWAHKHLLHRRTWPFEVLYDRHTPEHHAVYWEEAMAVTNYRELKLVLMPALGVLGAAAAMVPMSAVFGAVFTANTGWLFLTTAACYLVSYELLHTVYHLPEDHPLGRNPVLRWLSKHHARHHDPKQMRSKNFNVTLPLFDWLLGTMAGDRSEDEEGQSEGSLASEAAAS
ncbi:MAG: sterol desaturase family protein [Myxococcales bacterium]|nr:sterol desaturase family protein [Polyangiaceae bacterium]MDW8250970.1 sterol desaturase family protein [Myxococcales bacterium]